MRDVDYFVATDSTGRTIAYAQLKGGDFNPQLQAFAEQHRGYAIGVNWGNGDPTEMIFTAEENDL